MIHYYELMGRYIVLDVGSGAVHELDRAAYELLPQIVPPMTENPPDDIISDEGREAWGELYALQQEGLLFSEDWTPPPIPMYTPLKALCMHVSHDCNLRCGYCFAGTGDFGTGSRAIMSKAAAERAIDYLLKRCGNRINLEVDFFGGEPLMAMDTVRHTVEYARRAAPDRNFRFTLTTNGVLLDDEIIEYLNREMSNVVLSLDGRREVNDHMRRTTAGGGSYEHIVPLYKKLLDTRSGDYYVRGTYTSRNTDFFEDIKAMAAEGFQNLSVEPVSLPPNHPLAITEAHLPALFAEYEKLTEAMLGDPDFSFFHFSVDLEQGPCVYKRLRGCGAGYEYAAVTPEGDVYPCHQFVGKSDFKLGNVFEGSFDEKLSGRFKALDIFSRPACADCWAKFYCSGGCSASNITAGGSIESTDAVGCALERKRLECAILLKVAEFS